MKKIPRAAIDYCHLLIKNVGVANKTFIYMLNYNKQFQVNSLENKKNHIN